ncbi:MAG: hypothetical protein HY231_23620 [Acidobacteria bacterium]|nr:hypothetical protein [Acidobacteriota bacterium]
MYKYEVGKLYHPARTQWPEVTQYNFRAGQHELVLFLNNPTPREREALRRLPCEFGLRVEQDVIFLLYRFGGDVPWSDAPYSIHLVPESERQIPAPELSAETRTLLQVVLVDARTGLIVAMRAVTLSPEFTAALQHAIYEQHERPWIGASAYDAQIQQAYEKYPTSEAMTRQAIKTKGGA